MLVIQSTENATSRQKLIERNRRRVYSPLSEEAKRKISETKHRKFLEKKGVQKLELS